jgi:hypothetical protein
VHPGPDGALCIGRCTLQPDQLRQAEHLAGCSTEEPRPQDMRSCRPRGNTHHRPPPADSPARIPPSDDRTAFCPQSRPFLSLPIPDP